MTLHPSTYTAMKKRILPFMFLGGRGGLRPPRIGHERAVPRGALYPLNDRKLSGEG